jgi:hypothetical protein
MPCSVKALPQSAVLPAGNRPQKPGMFPLFSRLCNITKAEKINHFIKIILIFLMDVIHNPFI